MGAQHGGGDQGWGRKRPAVILTYLDARDHLLTLRPVVEAGAHTLDSIPGTSILADLSPRLALISSKARGTFTGLPVPCPSVEAHH